jgi:hypothetical protein
VPTNARKIWQLPSIRNRRGRGALTVLFEIASRFE